MAVHDGYTMTRNIVTVCTLILHQKLVYVSVHIGTFFMDGRNNPTEFGIRVFEMYQILLGCKTYTLVNIIIKPTNSPNLRPTQPKKKKS